MASCCGFEIGGQCGRVRGQCTFIFLFNAFFVEGYEMKMILFCVGLALLGGLYLYFLETWRIGCAVLWFVMPAYIVAAVAIMEK